MPCVQCGLETVDGLCGTHEFIHPNDWAISNRAVCAFVHRGVLGRYEPLTDEERCHLLRTDEIPVVSEGSCE